MLRILLIEDNPGDARLIEEMLKEAGVRFEMKFVDRLLSATKQIKLYGFDVILLDLGLPDSQGLGTLTKLNEIKPEAPVIVLTGLADEAIGTQAVKEGAQDYLIKGQIDKNQLSRSINYAIERKRAEKALRESEERFRQIAESTEEWIWEVNPNGLYTYASPVVVKILGYKPGEIVGKKHFYDLFPSDMREQMKKEAFETFNAKKAFTKYVNSNMHKNGSIILLETSGVPILDSRGDLLGYRGVDIDITERKRIEEALKKSEKDYRTLVDTALVGVYRSNLEGRFLYVNEAMARMFECVSTEEMLSEHILMRYKNPEDREGLIENLKKYGRVSNYEVEVPTKTGKFISIIISATLEGDIISGMVVDITGQKKLEEQLLHAQKLEAIGQLAGSIAHDFNNILTAVIGYANFLQMKMQENDPLRHNVDQILASSERAANLTQGLLTFSRKQVMNPRPVNLNEIIARTGKLLRRLIGEDIELKIILADEGLTVKADSGQIEQVLMNLATNARDAMPAGGCLIIETGLVELDSEFIRAHGYGEPGMYGLISVTDTGMGMDEKTREKIFEPFFTTKEIGKGTGLGLSIVYGIVKQHKGYINCYSEPGKGTTFRIYLPLIKSEEARGIESVESAAPMNGTETVLVAEDDKEVRKLTKMVLEEFGYKVIEAVDGEDTINQFMENKDKIHLLCLDLIMPKMNGKEVYERIKRIKPDIRVLFESGYPSDVIHTKDILEGKYDFISKPILPKELLRKIRDVLDK